MNVCQSVLTDSSVAVGSWGSIWSGVSSGSRLMHPSTGCDYVSQKWNYPVFPTTPHFTRQFTVWWYCHCQQRFTLRVWLARKPRCMDTVIPVFCSPQIFTAVDVRQVLVKCEGCGQVEFRVERGSFGSIQRKTFKVESLPNWEVNDSCNYLSLGVSDSFLPRQWKCGQYVSHKKTIRR